MLVIATAPWAHSIGDIAAWGAASLTAWHQHRHRPDQSARLARLTAPGYFLALAIGGVIGAWLAGTLNSLPMTLAPAHSIAGALAGGIFGAECWKARHGVRRSTGGAFVVPLAAGIMIGRLGCLFAGLADLTYGTATNLPWAVDLGDGMGRHPVQAYESLAMMLFLINFTLARRRGAIWATRHGFHGFIIAYATQRFAWEFLKPYPKLLGPFNLFHLLCLGLILYGIIWWRRDSADDPDTQGSTLHISQPNDQPV